MRRIKLEEWCEQKSTHRQKLPKGRPTPRWKLTDSIKYIKMRDQYLRKNGILVKVGKRRWKLNL